MTNVIPEISQLEGGKAYIRYCSGIAMLQRPEDWVSDTENIAENVESILVSAEQLIISGSRRFIHAAAAVEGFESIHKASEHFSEVAPVMYRLLDTVCEVQADTLDGFNPIFSRVKPAAFLDKGRYNNLTRGKYQRIAVSSMLDDMLPSELFAEVLKGRHCHAVPLSTEVAVA